jgi:ferrochelatase
VTQTARLDPYDAVLLVSFGGPEKPEDVLPFLRNVTGGRGIPDERLAEVGEHYYRFGGRSPINDQCRELIAALRAEFDRRWVDTPIYWGNRNWYPNLSDTCRQLAAGGVRRVLAITTSAYPSYSSCRQYRENLYDATRQLQLSVDRIRQYADHPGFVAASVDRVSVALDHLEEQDYNTDAARLVFVTHSIPTAMAEASKRATRGYVAWHRRVADQITAQIAAARGVECTPDLVYCSRSGPPSQPWLEPDVNDHLKQLAADGTESVVLVPIGFISDHMEVIYDLDTEAAETAQTLGLGFARAGTAGTHPAFVAGLADLATERAAAARGEHVEPAVIPGGEIGAYLCPADCCANLAQTDRPALCQL